MQVSRTLLELGLGPLIEAQWIHENLSDVVGAEPPFLIKPLIEHFGLEVDSYPIRGEMGGCLLHDGDRHYILVNHRQPLTRRRWSAAHELYHYLAHRWRLAPFTGKVPTSPEHLRLEAEANAFAAELLAPAGWTIYHWRRLQRIRPCAEAFALSITAMTRRLSELGLLRRRGPARW